MLLEVLIEIETKREHYKEAIKYLEQALEIEPSEVLYDIENNEELVPLRELQEYQEMVKKYK